MNRWKRPLRYALVAALLAFAYFRFLHRWPSPPAGAPAPEIAGVDLDGRALKLSDFRGKVTVLTFWGYWCGTCRGELPAKQKLAAAYADRSVAFVGVNSDPDREDARRQAAADGLTWPSFWNDGRFGGLATDWGVRSWPTTFVLDRDGVLRFSKVKLPELAARIEELLAERR